MAESHRTIGKGMILIILPAAHSSERNYGYWIKHLCVNYLLFLN